MSLYRLLRYSAVFFKRCFTCPGFPLLFCSLSSSRMMSQANFCPNSKVPGFPLLEGLLLPHQEPTNITLTSLGLYPSLTKGPKTLKLFSDHNLFSFNLCCSFSYNEPTLGLSRDLESFHTTVTSSDCWPPPGTPCFSPWPAPQGPTFRQFKLQQPMTLPSQPPLVPTYERQR